MWRVLGVLALCLCPSNCWAVDLTADMTEISVGDFCEIAVGGIEKEELSRSEIVYYPRDQVRVRPVLTWTGDPLIWFSAEKPGKYLLRVSKPVGNKIEFAEVEIVVSGEGPLPPDPTPNPEPDPKPEPGKRWIILVEETSQRTASQARLLTNFDLRKYMSDHEHVFRLLDKDSLDEAGRVPPVYARYLEKAKVKALPLLFIVSEKGILYEGALPETGDKLVALIQKFGG